MKGKLPVGKKAPPFIKVTTGSAADKTAKDMVAKSKRGEGTLSFTPNKGKKY